MRIDLHLHTTHSDGTLAPTALLQLVAQAGLDYFSITDHDTLATYHEHADVLNRYATRLLSGVELSTALDGSDIHILGYNISPDCRPLKSVLGDRRAIRERRAKQIVDKLNDAGVSLTMEEVRIQAGSGSIGRPHVARALVQRQAARDVSDAFARFLGQDAIAYVPSSTLTPADAIGMIKGCGGVAVLAHPVRNGAEAHLPELLAAGLDGIEAYSPSHTPHDVERFCALARQRRLVITGGTDFHQPTAERPRPGVEIEEDDLTSFLELVAARAAAHQATQPQ